ncbi:MAG TPA: hypothetical protein VHL34_24630 [Rhizomicrobium sp.]|jgi:hypothetical protein|nr:hypothetical protein [Rhizomicrobium sp.]
MLDIEHELRCEWWLGHGCDIAALYADDGEMQCSACRKDFLRDDLLTLRLHVQDRRLTRAAEALTDSGEAARPAQGTTPELDHVLDWVGRMIARMGEVAKTDWDAGYITALRAVQSESFVARHNSHVTQKQSAPVLPPALTRETAVDALENVRLAAARGRCYGHQATPQTLERMVEQKDKAFDAILKYCADAGVVGSILRGKP